MAKRASPEKLRQMTKPDVDVGAAWRELSSQLDESNTATRGAWWVGGFGLAVSAALVVILALAWRDRDGTSKSSTQVLADGSIVKFEPGTIAEVKTETPAQVGIFLTEGVGTFNVTKNPERQFEVFAGDTTVRVVGTRFSVERHTNEAVDVDVDEGAVEVRTTNGSEVVRAGESWTSESSVETAAHDQQDTEFPREELADTREVNPSEIEPGPPPSARRNSERVGADADTRADVNADGNGGADANADDDADTKADPATDVEAETADSLFDDARERTQRARYREAVALFSRFLERYGDDERAGWVAFEIARLAMDYLSDLSRAERMLTRALQLEPDGAFVPDVLARQVSVFEALGQWDRCVTVRKEYLESFPLGAHVPQVREACTH